MSCSNTRAAISAAHARDRAGDVFGGLALVDADFLFADVDRVAAERRDRDLDRHPRARRRLLEQRGDRLPGEHRRHRVGVGLPRDGVVEDARERAGIEVVDLEEVAVMRDVRTDAEHRGEDRDRFVDLGVGDEQRRREPQRAAASPR